MAQLEEVRPENWARRPGLDLYFGSSVKGEAGIDWADQRQRRALLGRIVADADNLLELARQAQGQFPQESIPRRTIEDHKGRPYWRLPNCWGNS